MSAEIFNMIFDYISPLQLKIVIAGFVIGIIIGLFRNKTKSQYEQSTPKQSKSHQLQSMQIVSQSPQNLILSYSLSTGQSFQNKGIRYKLFKGHLYQYLPLIFSQNQQNVSHSYQINKNTITKTSNDGKWIKLYNLAMKLPQQGKYYFNVFIVKNQYFIKRQGSQKAVSNVAVSRTDIAVGFFLLKQQSQFSKIKDQVQNRCHQSEKQSNGIQGISAYGFNGRIYNNGDTRTQQKIIKKNKQFTVVINRDDGFIGYEYEGQTIGFSVIPKDTHQIIPFVQMYAVGSSLIISS